MDERFILQRQKRLPELNGFGRLFRHVSGAQICLIENDDENRVFCVSFVTPPSDDAGLPHILEHTVLAGSKRFPLKEPFNELLKGSLYTYLNATTYREHTIFPIASGNAKDYLNLMEVYLDAVFNPLIAERPESFWQEGVQYTLANARAPLALNGIVYNEMQGADADPRQLLENEIARALYPRAALRFRADGDPARIPMATREALLAYHRTHYTAANSYFYVYGCVDVDKAFACIDAYVSKAETGPRIVLPAPAKLRKPVFPEAAYTAGAGAGNVIGAAYALGDVCRAGEMQIWSALTGLLFDTEAAVLRRTLQDAGFGQRVTGVCNAQERAARFVVCVQSTDATAADLREVMQSAVAGIVQNGLDAAQVEAYFNRAEFTMREKDNGYKPIGLAAHVAMLPGWLHGGDPFAMLSPLAGLQKARRKAENGEMEARLAKGILHNPHSAFVTLRPDASLTARREAALAADLHTRKTAMSESEITRAVAETKQLARYQAKPERKRDLARFPLLSLGDVRREAVCLPVYEGDANGVPMLLAPDGEGVIYARLLFRTDGIAVTDVPYLGVLSVLLGALDTTRFPSARLATEIAARLGGFTAGVETIRRMDGRFSAYFTLSVKALPAHVEDMFSIATEVAQNTVFTDTKRIRALLAAKKAALADGFVSNGHASALRRAAAGLTPCARYMDEVSGIAFYDWLAALLCDFDSRAEALRAGLRRVFTTLFTRENAIVTGSVQNTVFERAARRFANGLQNGGDGSGSPGVLPLYPESEAFVIPSRVQCNALCADFRARGYAYSGWMHVLQAVVGQGYLMEEIRLKGGAYGYGAAIDRTGLLRLYTDRDPRLAETYAVFTALPQAIARFDADERTLRKYILGAVNELDRPPRPGVRASTAISLHLAGVSAETRQAERDALLDANAENIRGAAGMLEACICGGRRCTFGAAAAIEAERKRFGSVRNLCT